MLSRSRKSVRSRKGVRKTNKKKTRAVGGKRHDMEERRKDEAVANGKMKKFNLR